MLYSDFDGLTLSRLAFGMMRLPVDENNLINETLVEEMVDLAIQNGVNYFDTAYPYHGGHSEVVTGKLLSKYPRSSYYLATKYPGHQYADEYHPKDIFEEQLKKCNVDYFDFYLLHNVTESSIGVYMDPKWGIVDYFVEQKKLGRIKYLGFSSHGEYNTLKTFLDFCGDRMEFCQIQLNYLDWVLQDAKSRYDLLTQRNIPIWVMEPVRGGKLAHLPESSETLLKSFRPDDSVASWAFRWLQALPNVRVILSGMSSLQQMTDNIHTFSSLAPLSPQESDALQHVRNELHNLIPCTACRYCCDGCPRHLDIPRLLASLNDARFQPNFTVAMRLETMTEDELPTACIGCGACESICPQQIHIPELMSEFAGILSTLPSWKRICLERAEAARKLKQ